MRAIFQRRNTTLINGEQLFRSDGNQAGAKPAIRCLSDAGHWVGDGDASNQILFGAVRGAQLYASGQKVRCLSTSLTNGIKALEEELGGDLFTRQPNIAVTPLGSTIRPGMMRVARDAEKVLEVARSLRRSLVYEPLSTRSGTGAGVE